MLAHQFGVGEIERARVRLLLGDAYLRQVVDQDLGLDLQLAGQFIDANLICIGHEPFRCKCSAAVLLLIARLLLPGWVSPAFARVFLVGKLA